MSVLLDAMRDAAEVRFAGMILGAIFVVGGVACRAQDAPKPQPQEAATPQNQLAVNWLYGAYIPKDAPRIALTGDQRFKLFVRQSFTTRGFISRRDSSRCMIR